MLESQQLSELRSTATDGAPNRVKVALRLARKTQREVARALEMTEPHLSDVITGRISDPRKSTLEKLAHYFGCDIEDLFPSRAA